MKKVLLLLFIIFPLIFMSCSNKVVDENKPNEKPNITENNNKPEENNEIKEEEPIENEKELEEPEKIIESETESPEDIEVISPIEPFIDSRFGYLESIYLENDDYYLALDEAEVFFGKEAIEEATLDNKVAYDENGTVVLYSGYYIRNNYDTLSNFKIAKDAKFYICGYALKDERNDNSDALYEVSFDEFKEYTIKSHIPDKIPEPFYRWRIWADVQDGVAIKLYQQFFP